jgi:hypothetical protein
MPTSLQHPAAADDLLHHIASDDYTLVETSYYGFNIPSAAINVEIFHWFHPVLGTSSGGVLIWSGDKADSLHAEYVDFRAHMPYPADDGAATLTFPTGVTITVVDPLRAIDIAFDAPADDVSFDVSLRAIMPAVGPGPGHLCQAVSTKGHLVLNSQHHAVDGWFTRDRSWSNPRSEQAHPIPPITWAAAVFDDHLAMHFVGFESDELSDQALQWGYLWKDGELRSLTRLRKHTERALDGMSPRTVDVVFEDSAGELHSLRGERQARLPFSIWPNMVTEFTQMRWDYGDRTGYGDLQDVQFANFRRAAASPRPADGPLCVPRRSSSWL